MSNEILTLDELRDCLTTQNKHFLLFDELPSQRVELQFEGYFDSLAVVWNACVRTIKNYAVDNIISNDPMQIIDIHLENGHFMLEVVLNLNQIDQPALERTIIMIRKYKRLRLGLHEYAARSRLEE